MSDREHPPPPGSLDRQELLRLCQEMAGELRLAARLFLGRARENLSSELGRQAQEIAAIRACPEDARGKGLQERSTLLQELGTQLRTLESPLTREHTLRRLYHELSPPLRRRVLALPPAALSVDPDTLDSTGQDSRTRRVQVRLARLEARLMRRSGPRARLSRVDGSAFLIRQLLLPAEARLQELWQELNQLGLELYKPLWNTLASGEQAADPAEDPVGEKLLHFEAQALQDFEQALEQILQQAALAAGRAGSLLEPVRHFRPATLRTEYRRRGRELRRHAEAWKERWRGEWLECSKDADLLCLRDRARLKGLRLQQELKEKLVPKVSGELQQVMEALQESFTSLAEEEQDASALRRRLYELKRGLSRDWVEARLAPAAETILRFRLEQRLRSLSRELGEDTEQLRDRYAVMQEGPVGSRAVDARVEEIPLAELVRDRLEEGAWPRLEAVAEEARVRMLQVSNEIGLQGPVIDAAFETALLELRGNEDGVAEARQLVLDCLERSRETLAGQCEALAAGAEDSLAGVAEALETYIAQVLELMESERLLALKLSLARSRAGDRLEEWGKKLREGLRGLRALSGKRYDSFRVFLRERAGRTVGAVSQVTRLGIRKRTAAADAVIQYLRDTRFTLESLPAIYRRLFRFEPLGEPALLVGRDRELEVLGQAIEDWRAGHNGLLALIGERGSGRSTLLQLLSTRLPGGLRQRKASPPGKLGSEEELLAFLNQVFLLEEESLEALEKVLSEGEGTEVVLLEDTHRLFLRTIEGLEVFNRFLLLMARTHDKVFWLLSCGLYAWLYLDKVLGVGRYVGQVLELKGLPADSLEELLLKRHRLSGIPLVFRADEATQRSKSYRRLESDELRQEYLRGQFFEKLCQASGGNISVAMLQWLSSLRNQENRSFEIDGLTQLDAGIAELVDSEELFAIATTVQHESLTSQELARVFSVPERSARLLQTGLANKGILVERQGSCELHFFLYRTFVRALYEKRFLH